MWKTMDKENTPPPERRGPRAITPPTDNERRLAVPEDVKSTKIFFPIIRFSISLGGKCCEKSRLCRR